MRLFVYLLLTLLWNTDRLKNIYDSTSVPTVAIVTRQFIGIAHLFRVDLNIWKHISVIRISETLFKILSTGCLWFGLLYNGHLLKQNSLFV